MRDLKFRAWDNEHKCFVYEAVVPRPLHEEWQQSTGLIDKNGRPIYEGDVVRGSGRNRGQTLQIRWKFKSHCAGFILDPFTAARQCEVVGNLYETE